MYPPTSPSPGSDPQANAEAKQVEARAQHIAREVERLKGIADDAEQKSVKTKAFADKRSAVDKRQVCVLGLCGML